MTYIKPVILTLLIAALSSFSTLQTRICYSGNPPSTKVNNLYSSVVLISHKKLKTSALDALRFAAFVAGKVAGTGSFGVGSISNPVHTEKSIGTGFQTQWGVVTNAHVMDVMPKAVLTTFRRSHHRIKKINRITCRDQHVFLNDPKIIQAKSKEATIYDWGGMDIDLALIHVKIPGAFPLPLATEVYTGEEVFTLGHPEGKQFTPSETGFIERMYNREGIKHIELSIEIVGGRSGSPVLNMKGEVVGVITGYLDGLGTGEAIHVDELRKIFGLPLYDTPERKHLPSTEPRSGAVYSTAYSRFFHRPDCNALSSSDGDLITFLSREDAIKNSAKPCPECNP